MNAIVAMDLNRVIGNKGKLPWHISDDLKWFKTMTMGGRLIMGNTTFKSVGMLPGRVTYVLTNDVDKRYTAANNLRYVGIDDIVGKSALNLHKTWLVGGASTYSQLIGYCHEVYVTHVLDEYEGDVYMPEFESKFPNSTIIKQHRDYWIVKYWKNFDVF